MNTQKWLKRKYPTYYKLINIIFSEKKIIEYLRTNKYELAILKKSIDNYTAGTIFLVRKRGTRNDDGFWDGSYIITGLFKCETYDTDSGYHLLDIYDCPYYELLKENK